MTKRSAADAERVALANIIGLLIKHVTISETGCWLWGGPRTTQGYADVYDGRCGKRRGGHIVSYEIKYGAVPVGFVLDHIVCDTRHCVNPDHVRVATNKENVTRSNDPRMVAYREGRCTRGHAKLPDNGYVQASTGKWRCRICNRERMRLLRLRDPRAGRGKGSTKSRTSTLDTGGAKGAAARPTY